MGSFFAPPLAFFAGAYYGGVLSFQSYRSKLAIFFWLWFAQLFLKRIDLGGIALYVIEGPLVKQ